MSDVTSPMPSYDAYAPEVLIPVKPIGRLSFWGKSFLVAALAVAAILYLFRALRPYRITTAARS